MRQNTNLRRLAALLLCAMLCAGLLAPCASAQGDVVYIRSRVDWEQLIQNCRLDTWSQGKTVVLECDLELIGDAVVPTFGGTFEGGGHIIRGVKLSGEGDHQGLFRYVQEGGVIQNLTVAGVVSPSGSCSAVGGVAGVNRGTIAQCQYQGLVSGTSQTGGIAGINEAPGQVINCTVTGSISGEHYTGGIVGENFGSVTLCTNQAQVNTQQSNISPELGVVNWEQLNSTENIPACTDTGGIAGYSKGVIQSCSNYGAVGYPHTGYNVGGVVGRQSGYVDGCVNHAAVQGRKEVGGVVGQMEPYTLLKFEETTLNALLDQLEVLSQMLDSTLDDTDLSRNQLSGQLTAAADLTDSARQDAFGMLDDVKELGDGTIDTVNDLSARVSRVIDQSIPAVEDLQDFSRELGRAIRRIESGFEALESAAGEGSGAVSELRRALSALKNSSDQVEQALDSISQALSALQNGLGSHEETSAALEQLTQAVLALKPGLEDAKQAVGQLIDALGGIENLPNWGGADLDELSGQLQAIYDALAGMEQPVQQVHTALRDWVDAVGQGTQLDAQLLAQTLRTAAAALKDLAGSTSGIRGALEHIQKMGPFLDGVQGSALDASERIRSGLSALSEGSGSLTSALDRLEDTLQELSDEPDLEFPKLDSSFHEKEDRLEDTLDSLMDQLDQVHQTVQQAGDTLSGNLRGIVSQFQSITQLLRDTQQDTDEEEHVVDISEENVASITLGKVSGCVNYGEVAGDVNIGGLTGSMAIEFDFDPEDDVTSQGSYSLNFQYLTRAVLCDGVNYAPVTARKDGAGGIVGRMGLGLLLNCQGYGDVESTRGEYVGGIAGISYAAIRNSWAKCSLTGAKYVGGIAGFGSDISGCRSLVQIADGTAYTGAIAGEMDGVLADNYFVSGVLGGVDGVSYFGKAQPMEYEDFLLLEGVPSRFQTFTITFLAQGETVAQVPFQYGAEIAEALLPQVPERDGFYGQWEDFEREHPQFDAAVEAVYTPWLTAIASNDGKILAEGSFIPGSSLQTSASEYASPALSGREKLCGQWRIETQDEQQFTALRLAVPEGRGKPVVWLYSEQDGWEQIPHTQEGSYLRVELTGQSAVLCVTQAPAVPAVFAAALCAAAAGIVLVLIGKKGKAAVKKRPRKTPA